MNKPRLKPVRAGQTWFVVLPQGVAVTCVSIDEVTPRTVALRREADLGSGTELLATRWVRSEVRWVERIP